MLRQPLLNFVTAVVIDSLGTDGHHNDTAILGNLIARHLDARRPRCLEGTSKIRLPKLDDLRIWWSPA